MNMILHNNPTALIKQGNTLADPQFKDAGGGLKTFGNASNTSSCMKWLTCWNPLTTADSSP